MHPPPLPRSKLVLWVVLGLFAVVIVVGVLATRSNVDTSKKQKPRPSEAELQLKLIEKRAKTWFYETAAFPEGDTGLTPARPCCEHGGQGGKCAADESLWRVPGWDELELSLDEPHSFQYSYRGTFTAMTATAVGDLDCDGVTMTYTLEGTVVDGAPVFTLTKPATVD